MIKSFIQRIVKNRRQDIIAQYTQHGSAVHFVPASAINKEFLAKFQGKVATIRNGDIQLRVVFDAAGVLFTIVNV